VRLANVNDVDRSTIIEQALESAWESVQWLIEQAAKDGYRYYSSKYRRGELQFNMSDGATYGRGVTLDFTEWFRKRGFRCMRADGLEIKAAIDARVAALGIAKDKGMTFLR
jgi:hypothetical protein